MPRLVDARHVRDFVLWLRFSDGTQGEVDLAGELNGPVFEPLKDPAYFRSLRWILTFTRSSGRTALIWHRSFCTNTSTVPSAVQPFELVDFVLTPFGPAPSISHDHAKGLVHL